MLFRDRTMKVSLCSSSYLSKPIMLFCSFRGLVVVAEQGCWYSQFT